MKTLILSWAILLLAGVVRYDEWYIYIPMLAGGMILLSVYHSNWIQE